LRRNKSRYYSNRVLINDLSAVSAYISKLNISEDLASELFNLAIKRREFRFLFEEFGLLKGEKTIDFSNLNNYLFSCL
jgi:hypothetical protein